MDPSMNRLQSYLHRHTASIWISLPTELKLNQYFLSPIKNIYVRVCLQTLGTRLKMFCDAPADYKVGGILQTTVTVTALPLGTEKPQIRVSKTLPCDCGCRDGWTQSTWKPRSHSEHRSKSVYTHIHTLLSPIWFLHWNFYLQMPITN